MTATPAPLAGARARQGGAEARARLAALSRRVAALRPKAGGLPLEKVLLAGGALIAALGIAAILLGWYGVAHTSYVFEQNSYIVSGGLLGVALVVAGATLYLSFWVTKRYRSAAAENRATVAALRMLQEQIQNLTTVTERLAERTDPPAPPAKAAEPVTARFVATARGSQYHLPGCSVVAGRANLRHVTGREPGLAPCRICTPDAAPGPKTARGHASANGRRR